MAKHEILITDKEKNSYKLTIVKWVDSARNTDWHFIDPTSIPVLHECVSVGFLVKESEDVIVLYPHVADLKSNDFQGVGSMTIPKKCITSLHVINSIKPYKI